MYKIIQQDKDKCIRRYIETMENILNVHQEAHG